MSHLGGALGGQGVQARPVGLHPAGRVAGGRWFAGAGGQGTANLVEVRGEGVGALGEVGFGGGQGVAGVGDGRGDCRCGYALLP
ncbi:hypothetical protein AB0J51_16055 [Micromonospora echinofusca]|uniref:hypothetical protein n=1 Tax=Micromonospora echinofusca TaxID=47858 RepID=UPI0034426BF0